MPRYCLKLEYDGTPFAGWQRQADALSVQQVVEEAIEKMSGEKVVIQAAGRTDSGVHALGQVVSFDLSKEWDAFKIREALNFHTKPHPVAIVEAAAVPDTFEARFSAIGRHYEYRILNRRGRPALEDLRVWHCPMQLDAGVMHAAAQLILGKHDFTTFRAAECSFLHSQVRSMVGSLKLVGEGKWAPRDFRAALDARERSRCGPLAPPEGLYLVRVDY